MEVIVTDGEAAVFRFRGKSLFPHMAKKVWILFLS